jgi:hypothetical protein
MTTDGPVHDFHCQTPAQATIGFPASQPCFYMEFLLSSLAHSTAYIPTHTCQSTLLSQPSACSVPPSTSGVVTGVSCSFIASRPDIPSWPAMLLPADQRKKQGQLRPGCFLSRCTHSEQLSCRHAKKPGSCTYPFLLRLGGKEHDLGFSPEHVTFAPSANWPSAFRR